MKINEFGKIEIKQTDSELKFTMSNFIIEFETTDPRYLSYYDIVINVLNHSIKELEKFKLQEKPEVFTINKYSIN